MAAAKGRQVRGYDVHRQKPLGCCMANFHCPRSRLATKVRRNLEGVLGATEAWVLAQKRGAG